MRNILVLFFISLFTFGLVVNDAAAKRFGGGKSFGVQRSQSSLSKPAHTQNSAMPQSSPTSKWGGMLGGALGGLLIGGLLTSLLMGNGVTSGILTWLLIGGVVFLVVSILRRRMQPGFQSAGNNQFNQSQSPFSQFTQTATNSSASYTNTDTPPGFDSDEFLREAKVMFNRLQAAYDQKNLQDINQFTAPEVFGEIKMQMDEIGASLNKTEVISLEAELLDVSRQVNTFIASVRFTGNIKENDEPMAPLNEIWHFRKFDPNSNWVVGGIQQEA